MDIVAGQTIYPQFDWYWMIIVVVLVFTGIMMLGFEIFVFPGFGVLGVFGLVFLLGGSMASWVVLGPAWGALILVLSVAFSTAMFILLLKSKLVKNKIILLAQSSSVGSTEAEDLQGLIDSEGIAESDLRPAGIVEIDGKRVDVVSDGSFVERGSVVKVVAIDGPRVIVEEQKKESHQE